MKKIIVLATVVAILIYCMVVPASAESSGDLYADFDFSVRKPYFALKDQYVSEAMIFTNVASYHGLYYDLSETEFRKNPEHVIKTDDWTPDDGPLFSTYPIEGDHRRYIRIAVAEFPFNYPSPTILKFTSSYFLNTSSGSSVTATLRFTLSDGSHVDITSYPKGLGGFYNIHFSNDRAFLANFPDAREFVMPVNAVSVRLFLDISDDRLSGTSPLSVYDLSGTMDFCWSGTLISYDYLYTEQTKYDEFGNLIIKNQNQNTNSVLGAVGDLSSNINDGFGHLDDLFGNLQDDNDMIIDQIGGVTDGYESMKEQIDSGLGGLSGQVGNVQSGINDIQGGINDVQDGIGGIQSGIDDVNQNIGHLDDLFGNLQDDNDMIIEQIGGVTDGYESMKEQIDSGLGGLNSSFNDKNYNSQSTGIGDLTSLENQLFGSISGSLQNAENYFTGGLQSVAPYGNAMLAYTTMFNRLITEPVVDSKGQQVYDKGVPLRKSNVFSDLLTISLALGALVAILNIAVHASSVTNAHERNRLAEARRSAYSRRSGDRSKGG